jgi:hypothetical protein
LRGFGTRRKPSQTLIDATPMSDARGTGRDYLLRKLHDHGRDDLVAAVTAGRVSAYACAIALGWRKRPPTAGVGSPNRAKRRDAVLGELLGGNGKALVPAPTPETDGELSLQDSIQACELAWGPDASGSVFSSMEEAREAWARLGPIVSATCHRPYAAEVLKRLDRKKKLSGKHM